MPNGDEPKKAVLNIPFASGVDTKIHKHLLSAPALRDLRDMQFDKTGALNKRNGYAAHTVTNLTSTNTLKTIFSHKSQLCLTSNDGVQRYSPTEDLWKSHFNTAPADQFAGIPGGMLPCELRSERKIYQDVRPGKVTSAVTADGNYECIAWSDTVRDFSWVAINDLQNEQLIVGPLQVDIGRNPIVIAMNTSRFVVIGCNFVTLRAIGIDTALSPIDFGAVATLSGNENISKFDAHSDPTAAFGGIIATEGVALPSPTHVYRVECTAGPNPVVSAPASIGPLGGGGGVNTYESELALNIYYRAFDNQFWCAVASQDPGPPVGLETINVFSVDALVTAAAATVNLAPIVTPDGTNIGTSEISICDRAGDLLFIMWGGRGTFDTVDDGWEEERGWFRWCDLDTLGARASEFGEWFNSFPATKCFRPTNHDRPIWGIRTAWGGNDNREEDNEVTITPVGAFVSPYFQRPDESVPANIPYKVNEVRLATQANLAPAPIAAGAGPGKTLTGSANGALFVDGILVEIGDGILVRHPNAAADNGVYTVTQVGDGANPYILTRATPHDETHENFQYEAVWAIDGGSGDTKEPYVLTSANPITIDVTGQDWDAYTSQRPRLRTIARFQQDALSDGDYDTNVLLNAPFTVDSRHYNKICPVVSFNNNTFSCYRIRATQTRGKHLRFPMQPLTAGEAVFAQADYSSALDRIEVRFNADMLPQKVLRTGAATLLTGGNLWAYDGINSINNTPHVAPGIPARVNPITGLGANFPDGDYPHVLVFAHIDANGDIHRSAPSPSFNFPVVGGGADGWRYRFKKPAIPPAVLTDDLQMIVEAYITGTDGSLFHFHVAEDALRGGFFNDNSLTEFPVLTTNNADNVRAPLLYTTGGILENVAPPAPIDITTNLSRVWLISGEKQNEVWPSKILVDGLSAQFNPNLAMEVADESERLTAIAALDDKVIVFSEDKTYAISGEGPNNAGQGRFLGPYIISVDVGCISKNSIVIGPFGILFQSKKGIYQLDRSLTMRYVGAPVEDQVSNTTVPMIVNAAELLAEQNQVRFSLVRQTGSGDERTVVYDYFHDQWSVFFLNNGNLGEPIDATVHNDVYYMLAPGEINQETPGTYTDRGGHIPTLAQTAWINFSGEQGFHRVWRVYPLGEHASGDVRLTLEHDYEEVAITIRDWTEAQVQALGFVTGAPAAGDPMQIGVHVARQKGQSLRLTIEERVGATNDAGLTLSGLALVGKPTRSLMKLIEAGAKR